MSISQVARSGWSVKPINFDHATRSVARHDDSSHAALAVGDGLGFWKAVREVFPAAKAPRGWFH